MKRKVLLKGQAGLDLLHRISSIDIRNLATALPRTGLLLNSSGRIQSVFGIVRKASDTVEISFQDGFLELLEHYTFSERYELTPREAETSGGKSTRERILALEPEEGFEFFPDGETNPLEVNLASAIDPNKGCYPGQEVIEKIQALGSPARRLCLLQRISGTSALPLPAVIFDEKGSEAGKITSADGEYALAILKRTHLKEGVELETTGCRWKVAKVSG